MAEEIFNRDEENLNPVEDTAKGADGKSRRGFASMPEAQQREIASKGGKASHEKGTAHEFTSEEAREAGQKGGRARQGIRDDD